ncbi:hypothetical protein CTI12_AA383660 [Artemisia annua]|uniref:Uncharacterized protein n=1 Tax=Artemisia annua TaxID=35608 RepID=A0A2U1MGC1_ARTAN|nr:hypothetical protein CTI12_AA383660 [Artemisia annua]
MFVNLFVTLVAHINGDQLPPAFDNGQWCFWNSMGAQPTDYKIMLTMSFYGYRWHHSSYNTRGSSLVCDGFATGNIGCIILRSG